MTAGMISINCLSVSRSGPGLAYDRTTLQHSAGALLHRRHTCRHTAVHRGRFGSTALRASDKEEQSSGSDSTESLFAKELQKRGLNNASRDEGEADRPASTSTSTQQPQNQQNRDSSSRPPPAPRFASQLDKSRSLGSEGIEGLIPRLSELAKLGLTFFLAFGPFILVTVALFGGLFALFGEEFVHGGRHLSGIPYVDPLDLLDEPTQDPMIPFK